MGDTYPKFKAAVAQVSPIFLDRKATVEKACKLMMEASENGAKLIAFSEAYIPGYPYWIWLDNPSANYEFFNKYFEEAVVIPSPATEELCIGAREADIYVIIGMNEKLSTQMGTMWNTNLIIDNKGNILGKHRKIVPTFAEKMIWSRGDGSMLRVWETDIGRLGTLVCGNNTHCLYKYALIAQGEQVHVGTFPAYYQAQHVDHPLWMRVRTASYSLEGTLFNLSCTGIMNPEMIEILSQGDDNKRKWLDACRSTSLITNPRGETLAEILDKEDLVYADIDIAEMIPARQYIDIVGHYTRMDVVSLNLCQDEDRPMWHTTRLKVSEHSEKKGIEPLKQLEEIQQKQQIIMEELKRMTALTSKFRSE